MTTPKERSTRTWLSIGILFCLLWVLLLAIFGPKPPAPSLEGSGSGVPASYTWTFQDLDDRPATLAPFKGRPIFLNLWATWCPPCVAEMPSIARLADEPRLKDKGIAFVCISTDDSSEIVKKFLEGRSWNMKFFRTTKLPPVFLTGGLPATFIIAPDGRIAATQVGAAQWDSEETIALLEKLAAEGPGSP